MCWRWDGVGHHGILKFVIDFSPRPRLGASYTLIPYIPDIEHYHFICIIILQIAVDSINNHKTVYALSVEEKFYTMFKDALDKPHKYVCTQVLCSIIMYSVHTNRLDVEPVPCTMLCQ